MTQVGRYYYDPKRPVPIPQHKLELWPGYITAIEHYEGKEDFPGKASVVQMKSDLYGFGCQLKFGSCTGR